MEQRPHPWPDDEPPVDTGVLDSLRELEDEEEPDFLASLIETYLVQAPADLRRIEQAIQVSDAQSLERLAHGLKGASQNVGAMPLGVLCQRLEAAARTGDLLGAAPLLELARRELERVISFLRRPPGAATRE